MDGVLPLAASPLPPAASAPVAPTTGATANEGGFAGALGRSMAASVPGASAPPGDTAGNVMSEAGAAASQMAAPDAPTLVPGLAPPTSLVAGQPIPDGTARALAGPELPDIQPVAGPAGGIEAATAVAAPLVVAAAVEAEAEAEVVVEAESSPDLDPPQEPPLEAPVQQAAGTMPGGSLAPPPATTLLAPPLAPALHRPAIARAADEPDAATEDAILLPVEGDLLLAPTQAPPSVLPSAPSLAPAGLSASAPQAGTRAGLPTAPTAEPEALSTEDAIAAALLPESELDAVPEEPALLEQLPRLPVERTLLPAPPPNLTTSLWQAEALAPLAGLDSVLSVRPQADLPSAAPSANGAPPPPAARQVASMTVALAFAPSGTGSFNLSLDPAELGRVEIRVQREGDTHSVRITAERPETLALLQRDRHELDRNLADAGLRIDAGGIAFSLEGRAQDGGAGQRERDGQGSADSRSGRRTVMQEPEAPPPRLVRSLLDLNI